MKRNKNIFLFSFIILMVFSLMINIIIINSFTSIDIDVIERFDKIYFNLDELSKEDKDLLLKMINSNNQKLYQALLKNTSNPVSQFYGFAGYMKTSQLSALIPINSDILLSQKRVDIVYDGQELQSNLGYAILLLLNQEPKDLIKTLSPEFIDKTSLVLYDIFTVKIKDRDSLFYNTLIDLLKNKYPEVTKTIVNNILNEKYSSDKFLNSALIVDFIDYFPNDEKEQYISVLLDSNKTDLIIKGLQKIGETDNNDLILQIENLIVNSSNEDIIIDALTVFSSSLEESSVERVKRTMLQYRSNLKIVKHCLVIMEKYAEATQYEFLTFFLSPQYDSISYTALETVINVCYNDRPNNVVKTLAFVVNRVKNIETVKLAINFHIDNNIAENFSLILSRLSNENSEDMKLLAIKYLKAFKNANGSALLNKLSNDSNETIQREAEKLLSTISISE